MDYSPYKNTSSYKPQSAKKFMPYIYIFLAIIIGFLFFWAIKIYIMTDEGVSIYSTFQRNESIAETQINGLSSWTNLSDGGVIQEGDKIRIKKGNEGVMVFLDESKLYFGKESEIYIKSLKKDDEGSIFGDIIVNKDPILFSGNSIFNNEKLKIWINDSVYVNAGENTFIVENNIVSVQKGEKIHIVSVDTDGKIVSQKKIGIGQSLNADSFTLLATPDSVKLHPLALIFSGNSAPLSSVSESESLLESSTLSIPTVLSPKFTGAAIVVEKTKQKIKGTASLDTKKIIIAFSNGSKTEELPITPELSDDEKNMEWSYTASKNYETLLAGLNTYKIYAVDKNNERSQAVVIVLDSSLEDSDEDNSDEDIDDDTTGSFAITSPSSGGSATLSGSKLVLSGSAPSNAAFITISNASSNYSYTLTKFKKGNSTWKYWNSSLKAGTHNFVVYAKDANKKIIGTEKIKIIIPEASSSETEKPTATPKVTATKKPKPTATSVPAVTVSTMEAERN